MYSMVLLVALSGGGETPGCYWPGCCSWYCGYGYPCYGYYPYYGYYPSYWYYPSYYAYSSPVYYASSTVSSSSTLVARSAAPTTQQKEAARAPAAIYVEVPADAVLTFAGRRSSVVSRPQDATAVYVVAGKRIESKPTRRYFLTPDLTPGRPFVYQLEAQFQQNGRTVTVKKEITVHAGKDVTVSLGNSTSTELASR